jgi:DNA-binding response OmpR family regulator
MKKHLLIVDDEHSIRELCQEMLEEEGYEVTTAVDGQDALDKMDLEVFDLFLIDMSMPRISGLELMKLIKRKQPLAVIIVLTGFSSIEGAVKAVHAGAFQYLSKPINADELFEVVNKGLKHGENLYGPLQQAFEPGMEVELTKGEPILLRGFSPEEKLAFLELGHIRKYSIGESIPFEKKNNSIILVESGEVSVWLNNTSVDFLQKWDSFGEESFILAGSLFTELRAESLVKIRNFERKKLLDFFAYKGEKLLKRFIINLVNSMFFKWRKSLQRIIMLKLVSGNED